MWRKKKCRAWLEEQLPRRVPVWQRTMVWAWPDVEKRARTTGRL
jgi:hypothetical protein